MRRLIIFIVAGFILLALLNCIDSFLINTRILTTYEGHAPLAPLYSFFMPQVSYKNFLPVLIFLLFIFYLLRSDSLPFGANLAICFLFTVLFRVAFSLIRHEMSRMGTEFFVYPGEEFIYDSFLAARMGYRQFLATYPDLMPNLSLHGRHFPPGNALLLLFLLRLSGESIAAAAWAIIILSSLYIVPLMLGARRMFGSDKSVLICGAFSMLMPSSIIFGAVSMDALYAAIAAWPVCLAIYGLQIGNRRGLYLAIGLLLGIAMLFSFSTFPLGLLLLFLFLIHFFITGEMDKLGGLVLTGLGFVLLLTAVYLLTGFNFYTCLITAIRLNKQFMQDVVGQDLDKVYWYATYGNYAAFLMGAGFVLTGCLMGAAAKLRTAYRQETQIGALTLALLATILVAGAAGIYFMETERIWLFLAVWLAVPAAWFCSGFSGGRRFWLVPLLLIFLQTLIQESLLYALW